VSLCVFAPLHQAIDNSAKAAGLEIKHIKVIKKT
jgi:protein tyrosine phosphatase (PTP) superfamily phosphohydrolase (DUF442 family)